jgi:hypothetical protein
MLAGRLQPGSLHPTTYPLAVPGLPWPAVLGIALALIPAWISTPQLPAAQAIAVRPARVVEPAKVGR